MAEEAKRVEGAQLVPTGTTLTDAERAELEQLRAEKQEREAQEAASVERAELEQLRAEKERLTAEQAADEHIEQLRERNRKLMEPDEDLHMPLAQKLVLCVLAVFVAACVYYFLNS